MRLVAFSDLHLDTPFTWAAPPLAARLRQGLRDALKAALQLADEVAADAVLCAGDLYEHRYWRPDTRQFLERCFAESGRPVFLAPGNHDPLVADGLYRAARWSSNVHLFQRAELQPVALAPGFTLWGAAHLAPAGTSGFLDGFAVEGDGVHVALFHGSERSGLGRELGGKELHAPFDAGQIASTGLHHAVVGHYHRRREAPFHTYPGNPVALSFGEAADGGAVVLDVAADGSIDRRWVSLSDGSLVDVDVDATDASDGDVVVDRIRAAVAEAAAAGALAVRVVVRGTVDPAIDLDVPGVARGPAAADVHVTVHDRTVPGYDLVALRGEQSVRGEFVRGVEAAGLGAEEARAVLVTGLRAFDGRTDLEVAA